MQNMQASALIFIWYEPHRVVHYVAPGPRVARGPRIFITFSIELFSVAIESGLVGYIKWIALDELLGVIF